MVTGFEAQQIFDINNLKHPDYAINIFDWQRWRLTLRGGDEYLDKYLKIFSKSEEADDFVDRKSISYIPAFSKEALIEVRNSIYQRMSDIKRTGGTKSYQQAINGLDGGVDLKGSSMNTYMGVEILPELLGMGRVGVYVDMPERRGETLADNMDVRPYLYYYRVEDILSWSEDQFPTTRGYRALLLRDTIFTYEPRTRLPNGTEARYRYYWRDESDSVWVRFYNKDSKPIDPITNQFLEESEADILLNVTKIPFVMVDLGESLLRDIDRYQIALLNLASADMNYCRGANFPLYTEQFDMRWESPHLRRPQADADGSGEEVDGQLPQTEIKAGVGSGRRYPKGVERPGFIHPSAEPLTASMEKQAQLRLEIRMLMHLTLSMLSAKMASAESKGMDERPLESGLSYIGLLLEDAERQIGEIWSMSEGEKEIPTIFYPSKYTLKTDGDRYTEAEKLEKLADIVPSNTYKKHVCKEIAATMLSTKIPVDELQTIYKEIDAAEIVIVKPEILLKCIERGVLDPQTAADAMGFPEDTVEKAQEYQAKRLVLIQKSQTPKEGLGNAAARGVPDASADPAAAAKAEKDGAVPPGNLIPNQRGTAKEPPTKE